MSRRISTEITRACEKDATVLSLGSVDCHHVVRAVLASAACCARAVPPRVPGSLTAPSTFLEPSLPCALPPLCASRRTPHRDGETTNRAGRNSALERATCQRLTEPKEKARPSGVVASAAAGAERGPHSKRPSEANGSAPVQRLVPHRHRRRGLAVAPPSPCADGACFPPLAASPSEAP